MPIESALIKEYVKFYNAKYFVAQALVVSNSAKPDEKITITGGLSMIKDTATVEKPKKYVYMDQSILGEAIINFNDLAKSTWLVYQKNKWGNWISWTWRKVNHSAYKIILLYDNSKTKFNYNKSQKVDGKILKDILSKLVNKSTELTEKKFKLSL